jgi:hypothetical protein
MSEAQRRLELSGDKSSFYGHTHSDESKRIISRKALDRAQQPVNCEICSKPVTVHNVASHMKRAHTGEPFYSAEGYQSLKEAARQRLKTLVWCEECQKSWNPMLWARHVRRYHEGGRW